MHRWVQLRVTLWVALWVILRAILWATRWATFWATLFSCAFCLLGLLVLLVAQGFCPGLGQEGASTKNSGVQQGFMESALPQGIFGISWSGPSVWGRRGPPAYARTPWALFRTAKRGFVLLFSHRGQGCPMHLRHGRAAVTDRGFANVACPNKRPTTVPPKLSPKVPPKLLPKLARGQFWEETPLAASLGS